MAKSNIGKCRRGSRKKYLRPVPVKAAVLAATPVDASANSPASSPTTGAVLSPEEADLLDPVTIPDTETALRSLAELLRHSDFYEDEDSLPSSHVPYDQGTEPDLHPPMSQQRLPHEDWQEGVGADEKRLFGRIWSELEDNLKPTPDKGER